MREITLFTKKISIFFMIVVICIIFIKMQYFGKEVILKTIKNNDYVVSLKYKQKIIWGTAVIEIANKSLQTATRRSLCEVDQREDVEWMDIQFDGDKQVNVLDANKNLIKVDDGENPIKLP